MKRYPKNKVVLEQTGRPNRYTAAWISDFGQSAYAAGTRTAILAWADARAADWREDGYQGGFQLVIDGSLETVYSHA